MAKEYKEILEAHIKALEKAYKHTISILNQEPEKDQESGKIDIQEDKMKHYIDGLSKASALSDELLVKIKIRKTELKELEDEESPQAEKIDKEKTKEESNSQNVMNKHLQ